MKALVFGKTGQVATELARHVPQGIEAQFLGRADADLAIPDACAAAINTHAPDVVLNAAAYTAVDQAEAETKLASAVNDEAPGEMARACTAASIPLLHISTDYVFDGSGEQPWPTSAALNPLGAYGRSKLAGEEALRTAGGPHLILRTSWVFSAHGANFVKTMLRLAETRDRLTVVADQIGGPTAAADIAQSLWQLAQRFEQSGTYHYAGAPSVSWADFAREIFAQAGKNVEVADIPTSDYPTPAKRPANSRLDCSTLATDYGIAQPDWRKSLAQVLAELQGATA